MVAMAVVQAVDQMQIAGTATAGADRELAGGGGIGTCSEGGDFFVAGVHPADRT